MGPGSITHALKVPFEKIGSVARKRNTHHDEQEESLEESPLHGGSVASPQSQSQLPHHLHFPSPIHRSHRELTGPTAIRKPPADHSHRLFRRDAPSLTDEEPRVDREFHIRKLFLKGRVDDGVMKRSVTDGMVTGGFTKGIERQVELEALEKALAKETAFRQQQAEVDRKTLGESQARDRLLQLEEEIYVERVQ
jgi:hypothetical protein